MFGTAQPSEEGFIKVLDKLPKVINWFRIRAERTRIVNLKYSFNRVFFFKISLRSKYRAPDPVVLPNTGSETLVVTDYQA